ncbi:MAG: tRNA (guanosine(46)-N7)-methyltransferase TrmB [Candidatus Cloacimonetes bacterium]|nr:tRNA (guanosine(46)-N7)-methyltransferase TrmB [Candidatus Cloacimonadota bacterium]
MRHLSDINLTKHEKLGNKAEFYLLELNPDSLFVFSKVFGNSNPVRMEIGCGRGRFLMEKSLAMPDVNFLGFEPKLKRVKLLLQQFDMAKQPNIRLIRSFVKQDITRWIPGASIQKVYIQHPDPWPKRRHTANRLIQPRFLDALAYIMEAGGKVQITTDNAPYVKWIREHFHQNEKFRLIRDNRPESNHVVTFFEEIKKKEGFKQHYMEFERIDEMKELM